MANILLVDDIPSNLDVLGNLLSEYNCLIATNGPDAIEIAKDKNINLILLDVMMPVMDGYEVCTHLKKDPQTSDIPIIFVTAKDTTDDEIIGFELGAVDFITKPINPLTVKERVKTHLTLQSTKQELITRNNELQNTLEELHKTQSQLIQNEKLTLLGNLVASVAHEINTPLGAINTSNYDQVNEMDFMKYELPILFRMLSDEDVDLLMDLIRNLSNNNKHYHSTRELRLLKNNIKDKLHKFNIDESLTDLFMQSSLFDLDDKLFSKLSESNYIKDILRIVSVYSRYDKGLNLTSIAIKKVQKIVLSLKNYSRNSKSNERSKFLLSTTIDTVLTVYENFLKYNIELTKLYEGDGLIEAQEDKLIQVWTNLIHNAIQAMEGKGKLTIKISDMYEYKCVSISDTGVGIPDSIKDKIFDVFFTTKPPGLGTGIGMDIVKNIVEDHLGYIEFDSIVGEGTEFRVYLPK